ncbi:MAG TPA: peptidylprolyl isomerase [Blastocatellia bacterium]|jgi:peptidyl-prolyl cis-trans isomerase B (cyclophilin B)|nr:peptidylprolyl isomerase [Blastocatellia bacterium]
MKIIKNIFIAFLLGVFAFACSNNTAENNSSSLKMPTPKVAGPPVYDDEVAVFETDYGSFKIALYPDVAPRHVENFKKLIRDKFYDGTGFHRVQPDFFIQGGDPQTRGGGNREKWGQGEPNQPKVPAEFSTRPFARGTVGMARTPDPNSASSQFFICIRPNPTWDGQYTVFGEVIQGLNIVQIISNVPTDGNEKVRDLPVIKRAYLEKRQQ